MIRVTFYFDGFNFYYGLKNKKDEDATWKAFYWLDFVKFCEQFLGEGQILEKVKYFTTAPHSKSKQARQQALLTANRYLNPDKFQVIRGKYYDKTVHCQLCNKDFKVPEEKRTDVNISVHLVGDCAKDLTDTLVLVSADSDLVPPIEFITSNYTDKKVKLYFPPCRKSLDLLRSVGNKATALEKSKFKFENAVMEPTITSPDGRKSVTRPAEWIV